MAWPVIKLVCEVDKDYVELLKKTMESTKKLVEDGAIDRSVEGIEDEEYREAVKKAGYKLFGDVSALMEKVSEDLYQLSLVPEKSYCVEGGRIPDFDDACEDAEELSGAIEKFLDRDEWGTNTEYDIDAEDFEKYEEYDKEISIDFGLEYDLEKLKERTDMFNFS